MESEDFLEDSMQIRERAYIIDGWKSFGPDHAINLSLCSTLNVGMDNHNQYECHDDRNSLKFMFNYVTDIHWSALHTYRVCSAGVQSLANPFHDVLFFRIKLVAILGSQVL